MFNVNDANISMTSSSSEFRKLFVIEISSQESSKTSRQFSICEMKSNPENFVKKNVQVTLYRAEPWLLMLIEVVNRFKFWVKSFSQ